MRILAVRFQNLNSLRGSHELNLESGPLAEAGLFAITGPTGAGKSTILDAVTLALYARAARYGKDSAEDMMSRGTGECSSAVDFECAGGCFTAKWMQRRAKGSAAGNLQQFRHELSQAGVIIEEKTRGVVQRVEELTGLDYDRFLRSVLLAQGQFAAFIRAKRDERADLLERITGTHIYSDLGALAWKISTGYAREIQDAEIRLEGVVLMSGDERAAINQRLTELGRELSAHEEQQAGLTAKISVAKREVQWRRQSEEHAAAVEQHAAARKRFAPDEARLVLHAATAPFADALSALSESERTAQRAATTRDEAAALAKTASGQAARAAGATLACISRDEAATADERRDIAGTRRRTTEELGVLQQWLAAHAADALLAENLPELSGAVERVIFLAEQRRMAEIKCQAARDAAAEVVAESKAAAEKSAMAGKQFRQAAHAAAEAKAALATLCAEPWTSAERLEQELLRLGNVREALLRMTEAYSNLTRQRAGIAAQATELSSLQAGADKASAEDRNAREKLAAARQTEALLQELLRQEQLVRSMSEHRAHLEEGRPCPLCGAEHHPWADPAWRPAEDGADARLKKHQDVERALAEVARKAAVARGEADTSLAAAGARQQTMRQSLEAAQQSLEKEWHAHFPETDFSEDALTGTAQKAAEDHATLNALAEKVRAALALVTTACNATESAQTAAKICQAHAEAAEQKAAGADRILKEADDVLQGAVVDFERQRTELQAKFSSAGEPDADDPAAGLRRLKSRERIWREKMQAHTDLEKKAATLQHEMEKRALHAKTLEDRRRETEMAISLAGLTALPQPAAEGDWSEVNAAFAGAMAGNHAAEKMAAGTQEAAQKAAEQTAAQHDRLTKCLAGSAFRDVGALRAAQLDAAALRDLSLRERELREAAIRLESEQNNLAREASALKEEWQRIAAAEAVSSARVTVAGETTSLEPPKLIAVRGAPLLAEFETDLAALTLQTNSLRTERGALQQRLDADDAARANQAAAAARVEEKKIAAAPWARLNQLIGSAEGDKFSRYAQAATLDYLAAMANRRLSQLCERYRLVRCGAAADLQIQVCDAWQVDAMRPLESLSGGETFLISLALALALSELAGGRTRIGTLFIDEGFGTLDSAALDIALSALEGLRAGHSTIGIISHVEALRSRLTTQVEVVRGPGGWGTLRVKS